MSVNKVYCPSCGMDVEPFVLQAGREEVLHCSVCGLVLEEPQEIPPLTLKRVVLAEDTDLLRSAITRSLKESRFAEEVLEARNGAEFLGIITPLLQKGEAISLAILDVEMPVMKGSQAALGLRNLEVNLKLKRKIPILFFTAVKCDERFREFLEKVKPSSYVNKGASGDPDHLSRRVKRVLHLLMKGG